MLPEGNLSASLGLSEGSPRALWGLFKIKFQISDETSQDSIAATPKTENPFYQCPHCDDNFDSFDDVTNHIEDEHENNETGKNFVSFCVILCHFILNVTNHIEDEHENNKGAFIYDVRFLGRSSLIWFY